MLRNEQGLLTCDHYDSWKDNRVTAVSSHFESNLGSCLALAGDAIAIVRPSLAGTNL